VAGDRIGVAVRRGMDIGRIGLIGAMLALAACRAPVSTAGVDATVATPPAAPQRAATERSLQLAKFQNMSASDVVALIGEPDFRLVESPAEMWQYRSADCVVDLFLYHSGDEFRVTDEDARNRDPTRDGTRRCHDGTQVLLDHLQATRS
jgi:hypothetical protein